MMLEILQVFPSLVSSVPFLFTSEALGSITQADIAVSENTWPELWQKLLTVKGITDVGQFNAYVRSVTDDLQKADDAADDVPEAEEKTNAEAEDTEKTETTKTEKTAEEVPRTDDQICQNENEIIKNAVGLLFI